MPDTGAPWNIPYVESTDLVSDWPADSLALANAIDAGLDAAGNAGIGSNVVQAVKTDTYSQSSTSFEDVTDLSVTITPSSASSKILLLASVVVVTASTSGVTAALRFTGGNAGNFVGDADGNRTRSWAQMLQRGDLETSNRLGIPLVGIYLDSPAVATPVTYKVQLLGIDAVDAAATVYVNRDAQDTNDKNFSRYASQLTAIEVAA